MPDQCKECRQKQQRIDQLEELIRMMAESADKLFKQGEEVKEKIKTAGK